MADAEQLRALLADTLPLTDNFPKRYSQGAPGPEDMRFYASWMLAAQTRKNLLDSAWIDRFWPPGMRDASADYFLVHQALNVPEEVGEKGLRLAVSNGQENVKNSLARCW